MTVFEKQEIISIVNIFLPEQTLSVEQGDSNLQNLGISSIMFMGLIMELEDIFKVEIPFEYLYFGKMNTINKISSVIELLTDQSGDARDRCDQ